MTPLQVGLATMIGGLLVTLTIAIALRGVL
jgi:hypothetical protein